MNRSKQEGFGLIELMIALGVGLSLIAVVIGLSRSARGDALAARIIPDVSSLAGEIRSTGALSGGYAGLTTELLFARTSMLASSFKGSGESSAYLIQGIETRVGASSFALDADERPINTNRNGDSFFVQMDGVPTSLCTSLIAGLGSEATTATVLTAGTDASLGVRNRYDANATANACGRGRTSRVTIHFN